MNLFGQLNNTAATNVLTQVFAVSDTSWSETKITFNNKPAIGATALASATIADTTPRPYSFDITAYIKAQLAAGHKVITLALEDPSITSPFVSFNSREAANNTPALVVS